MIVVLVVVVVAGVLLGLSTLHIVQLTFLVLAVNFLVSLGSAASELSGQGAQAAAKAIRSGGFAFLRKGEVEPVVRSPGIRVLRSGGFSLLRSRPEGEVESWRH